MSPAPRHRPNDVPAITCVAGRYTLFGPIGSGGMATVHLARQAIDGQPARTVAVKRLHGHLLQDPELPLMFADEARVAARVRHPNVVATLDVLVEGGELLLVMEYVEGETLARLMRGAGVPLGIASAIVVGILRGLEAAHRATDEAGRPLDLVHRDVSPQNVLVGSDGVARLLDFGVAKASGRSRTTKEGQIRGKMAYMAPEQLGGEASCATDVYATAAVLWELLAGKPLFEADSDAMLLARVATGDVAPPSVHRPEVPPALDALVLRGLSRDPSARFATAREMAQALEEVITPSTPRDVAASVQRTATAALDARRRTVEAIEAAFPGEPTGPSTPTLAPITSQRTATTPPVRRRRGGALALGLLVLGTAALLGLFLSPLRHWRARVAPRPTLAATAPPAATATDTASQAPVEAPKPASPAVAPPTTTAAATTAPTTAPSTTAGRKPAVTRRPRSAGTTTATATPSVAAAPTSSVTCDPPYVIDPESGDRRYKRECLK